MKTLIPRCLLIALAGSTLAVAQNRVVPTAEPDMTTGATAGETSDANDSLPRGDLRFFQKAAKLNEKELMLSRQAAERATNPQVRGFASDMVRAHTTAGEELSTLATRKGARLEKLDAEKSREIEKKWAEKKADDFDEDYVEAMVEGHKDMIEVLEDGAKSEDTQIADFAQKLLPEVKAHHQRAQELEKLVDD